MQVMSAEKVKKELDEEKTCRADLEKTRDTLLSEIDTLKFELGRRDATIAELMEREKERNAEVEKLTRMAAQRQENDDDLELDPVASSVLCIKCKKALDDIGSIREAILGRSKDGDRHQRLSCESYRILLPNNKGKKPFRSNSWLKACMRSLLTSKMSETLTLLPIGENVSPLPSFVYAWFEPPHDVTIMDSHSTLTAQQLSDENRWGFYYGVKTLAKDNAEAKLFWGLLDEVQGNDGLIFVSHCLSVVLSIGGPQLWEQFGRTMNHCCLSHESETILSGPHPSSIWLELDTAVAAVRLIFVRALESQILETLDAIESLKAVPKVDESEPADEGKEVDEEVEEVMDEYDRSQTKEPTATHIDLFIWLRVMMERFQDEQCHRQAAIRLMFDTASMGALTGSSNSPRQGGVESHYDSDNPYVYFPQFSAVVKTLYPHMSLAETAELFSTCHKIGNGKVTANVFCDIAEMRHLFSKSLKLGPLPLLNHKIAYNGSITNPSPTPDVHIDQDYATQVRTQIGSLVHQRFAILCPEIESISHTLPNRWKALVLDACDNVRAALSEYFVALKSKKRNSVTNAHAGTVTSADGSMMFAGTKKTTSSASERYIDGLQPFIQYHRLLSIVLVVKSFTENTLLPTSFVGGNSPRLKSSPIGDLTLAVNTLSVKKVESTLSSLEKALFVHGRSAENMLRYERFMQCRRSFFARKVQNAFRVFASRDVIIPRALRFNMRPGYLTGLSTSTAGSPPMKSRRVFIEPWVAQSLVASTYALKLSYDAKAHSAGYPEINLANATASLLLVMFSAVDVAERLMQDLCLAIQTYMHGSPRLRMFACFLGFGEVDEPFATLLNSDTMLSTYFDLLMSIHSELAVNDESADASISALFPCSEDPATRTDKRDVWYLHIDVLTRATTRWSSAISGISPAIWENALTRVKRSKDGLAEVDDFLWVVMQVLIKEVSVKARKCDDRAKSHAAKDGQEALSKKKQGTAALTRTSSAIIAEHNAEEKRMMSLTFPHCLNVYYLQSTVESIRAKPSKMSEDDCAFFEADAQRCSSVLVSNYRSKRLSNFKMYTGLLKSCVIWDIMTGARFAAKAGNVDAECRPSKFGSISGRPAYPAIRSGVPPALSLRFYQLWWTTNKDCINNEVKELEVGDIYILTVCADNVTEQRSWERPEFNIECRIGEAT